MLIITRSKLSDHHDRILRKLSTLAYLIFCLLILKYIILLSLIQLSSSSLLCLHYLIFVYLYSFIYFLITILYFRTKLEHSIAAGMSYSSPSPDRMPYRSPAYPDTAESGDSFASTQSRAPCPLLAPLPDDRRTTLLDNSLL